MNQNAATDHILNPLSQLFFLTLTLTANRTSRQLDEKGRARTSPCQPGEGSAACEPAGKCSPEPDSRRTSSARGLGARDITPRLLPLLLSDCGSWSGTTAQLPAVQTDTAREREEGGDNDAVQRRG